MSKEPLKGRAAGSALWLLGVALAAGGCTETPNLRRGDGQVAQGDGFVPGQDSPGAAPRDGATPVRDFRPPPGWDGSVPPPVSDRCTNVKVHAVDPNAPHPRIWLTPERLTRLRQQAQSNTAHWQGVIKAATRNSNDLPQAEAAALAFAVTGDAKYGKTARDIAVRHAQGNAVLFGEGLTDQYRGLGQGMPIVYDWAHGALSEADRALLIKCMNGGADYDISARNRIGTDSDAVTGGAKTTMLIAAATLGENPKAAGYRDNVISRWEKGVKDWVNFDQSLRNYTRVSTGGVWMEGNKYSPDTVSYIFQIVEAEYNLSGRDLLCELDAETGHSFPADLILATLLGFLPGFEDAFTWADAESPGYPAQFERWSYALLYAADRIPTSQHARWAYSYINDVKPGTHGANTSTFLGSILAQYNMGILAYPFYRPELKGDSLGTLPIQHAAPLPGPGFVYARTSNSGDASGVLIQAGSIYRVDHVHFDTGSFQLYRKGEWLSREVRGYGLWPQVAQAHNTVILNGLGPQADFAYEWKSGKMAHWCGGPDMVFVAGDLTDAYNIDPTRNQKNPPLEDRGDEVTREWVFVRPQGWLVVFDRIEVKKVAFKKQLIFQVASDPQISGAQISARSLKGSQVTGTTRTYGDQTLVIRTVYPKSGATYKVEAGTAYYTNPQNAPNISHQASNDEVHPSERRWHVAVNLPSTEKREYALHVLSGHDAGGGPPKVEAIDGAGTHGVRIGEGAEQVEIVFHDAGQLGGTFKRAGKTLQLVGCQ